MKVLAICFVLLVSFSLLLATGCGSADQTDQSSSAAGEVPDAGLIPESEPETTTENEAESLSAVDTVADSEGETTDPGQLVLSTALKRGCWPGSGSVSLRNTGLAEGETAVEFTLRDIQGNPVSLSQLLDEKPVVIVFGSFT